MKTRSAIALLLLVPAPSLGAAAAMFWWPGLPLGKGLFLVLKLWLALFPLAWHRWVDRRPLSWSPAQQGGFGVAVGLGLVMATIVLAIFAVGSSAGTIDTSRLIERAARTGFDRPTTYLLGAFYWITANSLMEEYVWRWFVFRRCEVLWGGRAAVGVAALAFTVHHVVALAAQFDWGITLLGASGVWVGGAAWSWLYARYRSVWPAYVSHAIVDVAIFVVGYWLIFAR